jgi:hypothetical protein
MELRSLSPSQNKMELPRDLGECLPLDGGASIE